MSRSAHDREDDLSQIATSDYPSNTEGYWLPGVGTCQFPENCTLFQGTVIVNSELAGIG